jgi:hypothetical protein
MELKRDWDFRFRIFCYNFNKRNFLQIDSYNQYYLFAIISGFEFAQKNKILCIPKKLKQNPEVQVMEWDNPVKSVAHTKDRIMLFFKFIYHIYIG